MQTQLDEAWNPLIEVLRRTRMMLCREDNDFTWSSWEDAPAALREMDGILSRLDSGALPARREIAILFAPTGPLQEVSLSSGWSGDFLELAARCDAAMDDVYSGADDVAKEDDTDTKADG